MKKGRFLWSAHRITERQKAGKARSIKGKQLKNSRNMGLGGNATNKQMHKRVPMCPACRYAMGQKKARRTRLV